MRKCQKSPLEAIARMKATKHRLHVSHLQSDLLPEKSSIEYKIPSHRTQKQISIEEYKKLLDEGYRIKDFVKIGVSKHYVGFLNAMMKGKITLDKETLAKEYCIIPLEELSKKYNISREHLTYLREYYGIKRKGAKIFKRLIRESKNELTQRQRDISLGSLLGDAYCGKWGCIAFKQSIKQYDYCLWKFNEFKEHTNYKKLKEEEYYDERYDSINSVVSFLTHTRKEFIEMRNYMYKNDRKVVTIDWLNKINELALAVWFMDDGGTDWTYRNGIKQSENSLPFSKIYTCAFSDEENNLIVDWFKKKWNIECGIKYKTPGETNPYLYFYAIDTQKLFNIIRPHVIESMKYKIDEDAYLKYKEAKRNKPPEEY